MRNKYILPSIKILTLDAELKFMAGSIDVEPKDLQNIHDGIGNNVQLGKSHSLFDDDSGDMW